MTVEEFALLLLALLALLLLALLRLLLLLLALLRLLLLLLALLRLLLLLLLALLRLLLFLLALATLPSCCTAFFPCCAACRTALPPGMVAFLACLVLHAANVRSAARSAASPAVSKEALLAFRILHACLVPCNTATIAIEACLADPGAMSKEALPAFRILHALFVPSETTLGRPPAPANPCSAALLLLHTTAVCSVVLAACLPAKAPVISTTAALALQALLEPCSPGLASSLYGSTPQLAMHLASFAAMSLCHMQEAGHAEPLRKLTVEHTEAQGATALPPDAVPFRTLDLHLTQLDALLHLLPPLHDRAPGAPATVAPVLAPEKRHRLVATVNSPDGCSMRVLTTVRNPAAVPVAVAPAPAPALVNSIAAAVAVNSVMVAAVVLVEVVTYGAVLAVPVRPDTPVAVAPATMTMKSVA